ncbi:hypothetical protein [Acaryochloris thomasi]|uniref:hypothetical protein n=1 Tax=Acaryochloris thomasi TaxID=2929456 RepID=UPI0011B6E7C7
MRRRASAYHRCQNHHYAKEVEGLIESIERTQIDPQFGAAVLIGATNAGTPQRWRWDSFNGPLRSRSY